MSQLQRLAEEIGFHNSYVNCFGHHVTPQEDALAALVSAMGYDISNEEVLRQQADNVSQLEWRRLTKSCEILHAEDAHYKIAITLPVWLDHFSIDLRCEDGSHHNQMDIVADMLPCIESASIDGQDFKRYQFELPRLAEGYHHLTVTAGDQTSKTHLIVAPPTCVNPAEIAPKTWGIAVQLYSLKSANNWGLGDFSDLRDFVIKAAANGAGSIGLNPLHPLFPGNPAHRSPYSPTSRSFLNTMYIDVTAVPGYTSSSSAQSIVASEEFQTLLARVRSEDFIDYGTVGYLKYKVLRAIYEDVANDNAAMPIDAAARFEAFRAQRGEELENLACYDALYEYFRERDSDAYGWTFWPEAYQDPKAQAVTDFKAEQAHRITYFAWLQWLAHEQLCAVQCAAKEHGMPIGLYLDLAVGCDGNGAEVWADQGSYLAGAAVGAPPDAMNILGQDWGLTPLNPVALRDAGFKPLIQALRSSMQYAGALRIDHILGFMRQYWVAPGKKADEGVYISFPLADILRVIALESRRSQCIVVGEDLGTVPDGFGEIMAAHGLLSYKVLFFERWENGLFMRPEAYPEQAMATGSTHDLHTVAGWWTGRDLEWRRELNLYPNADMAAADAASRAPDREFLRAALIDMGLLGAEDAPADQFQNTEHALTLAAQQYLASTPSALHMIPAEDILELVEQVNIPGTTEEHPNWKRKLPCDVEGFFSSPQAKDIMTSIAAIRPLK